MLGHIEAFWGYVDASRGYFGASWGSCWRVKFGDTPNDEILTVFGDPKNRP